MIAGVITATVYLFGFVVTGRLFARDTEPGDPDGLLYVIGMALVWPLIALLFGLYWLARGLGWLLGVKS